MLGWFQLPLAYKNIDPIDTVMVGASQSIILIRRRNMLIWRGSLWG